jgi:ABC-type methionine transport system ATPase subunit
MRQKGVTRNALSIIKNECEKEFEQLNLTINQAFVKTANSLGRITASGRTLRKIFNSEHVRESTIRTLIKELGLKQSILNGKIDIKNEEEKEDINSEPIQDPICE